MAPAAKAISKFLAIDFETANYASDSACSVGLVRVEDGEIIEKVSHLIRPPTKHFVFTHIHGLTWKDVEKARNFGQVWEDVERLFDGVDFIAAHNVGFDKKVLHACCETYGIQLPKLSYKCSVKVSRDTWGIYPTKLSDVCRHLKIALNHHEALSDALACAKIMIQAEKEKISTPKRAATTGLQA